MSTIINWDGVPRRFATCTFEMFHPGEGTEGALAGCHRYTEAFANGTTDGLLIYGQVGSGKTHLAVATMRAALERLPGVRGQFMDVHTLVRMMQKPNQERGATSPLATCIQAELLLLDGICQGVGEEYVKTIVHARYDDCLPTIFTTAACGVSELAEILGESVTSRLFDMCDWVKIEASDFRRF